MSVSVTNRSALPGRRILDLTIAVGLVVVGGALRSAAAPEQRSSDAAAVEGPEGSAQAAAPQGKTGETRYPANRLAGETSPYLLMHAHNPVDWYPWGTEALTRARQEGKLIFLSIGYSSCYWCHVMERESFMDDEIAKFMNEHFVCIKVDREERPDLDTIYMTGVQLMTGRGGWPMSVFLTPEGKPFFGGTYFPPRRSPKYPRPGFFELMQRIDALWNTKRADVLKTADRLTAAIQQQLAEPGDSPLPEMDARLIAQAVTVLAADFDTAAGGFGYSPANPRMPKFPDATKLAFLLDRARIDDEKARGMLITTLDHMGRGGIYDQLGGGFHRYSTDRFWWVPHFEKMLYDNGQLASIYAEAHELTGREDFAAVARGICDYVLREMTDPDGGFYAAMDAETHAREGEFYVWTDEELAEVLGDDELDLVEAAWVWTTDELPAALSLDAQQRSVVAQAYGSGRKPLFEGGHVLMLARPIEEIASSRSMSEEQLQAGLARARDQLLAARRRRERPLTDTKILTSWNGLMIRGMADAGRVLGEKRYLDAAARAAEFILSKLRKPDGRLLRTYRANRATLNAYVDDYAFLVSGLIALHRATGDEKWLAEARGLTDQQLELFWDETTGGFFFTSYDHEALIARGKDPTDGALPSGNGVSAVNLLDLAVALGEPAYRDRARQTIQAALPWSKRSPANTCGTATAVAKLLARDGP